MAKQDDYTRYTIRIPTDLYERVKAAAGEKSVNAEIVATLEEKYPAPSKMAADEFNLRALRDLAEQLHSERRRNPNAAAGLNYLCGKMEEISKRLPYDVVSRIYSGWKDVPPERGILEDSRPTTDP